MSSIPRIFYNGDISSDIDNNIDKHLELDREAMHKVVTVLRLKVGDNLYLQSDNKRAYVEIIELSKKRVIVSILKTYNLTTPNYRFEVYQAITKREYMDFIVEKYAEIGVTKIIPTITSRSIQDLKAKTVERYRTIAINAALQSESDFFLEIVEPINLSDINPDTTDKIFFHERDGLKSFPEKITTDISMIIGAEGGFTEEEYNLISSRGFDIYTPIKKILKSETAAIAFATNIMIKISESRSL